MTIRLSDNYETKTDNYDIETDIPLKVLNGYKSAIITSNLEAKEKDINNVSYRLAEASPLLGLKPNQTYQEENLEIGIEQIRRLLEKGLNYGLDANERKEFIALELSEGGDPEVLKKLVLENEDRIKLANLIIGLNFDEKK